MKKKTKLLIVIPIVAVALNGLGYVVAINLRAPAGESPRPLTTTARDSTDRLSQDRGHPVAKEDRDRGQDRERARGQGQDPEANKAADVATDSEEKALARRAAGLAALDVGDYDRALTDFEEAHALAGDKAHVTELLRVTEDLAHRAAASRRPAPFHPTPPPPHVANRFHAPEPQHSVAVRQSPPPAEPAPVAAVSPTPTSGLLLVTTTPRGLLVQVDDVPVDLSPMRASLKIGSHRVALFDGDRKVYETSVDVKSGAPTTLLRDVSRDLPNDLAPTPRPSTPAAAFAKESPSADSPLEVAASRPSPAPVAARGLTPAARTSSSIPAPVLPKTGSLDITSPGLYGEIWINGRPRGFPPIHADDLPAGPARIGVRVNGVEQRSALVAVRPGLTTSVRLSRQEAAP